MPEKVLTTKLVIDLAALKGFGSQEQSTVPVDISSFSFLVLSDYSCAWNGFNTIIKLPPATTLRWELEALGADGGPMVVSQISLVFKLVGCALEGSKLAEWEKIFDCTGATYHEGTLEIQASNTVLDPHKPNTLSASIKTVTDLVRTYNLTYSIYMNFSDGSDDKKQIYFLKIDPLIKNNSNPPIPIP